MIQRQQFDSAVAVLTAEVEGQPELLPGWVLLGIAYHGKKDYAAALAANRKAVALAPSPVTPLYNGGLELGLLGQLDEAFEWMGRARSDGRLDMTALWNDPDAVPLRADPRFSSLQPTAEEYADPFVEPTTILREWVGEGARDQFGWVARDAGDVDGDGVRDVVTSAPTWGPNGSQAGKIYVYSSRTGALLWSQAGAPGEQLGLGIEAAGDVNADGVPDVIAGGPLAGAGRAVVYSGLDGRQLLEIKGAQAGEQFGRHVSDAGDIDGDGHDDILVTAPSHATSAGTQVGRVSIISGKDGSLLRAHQGEAPTHKFGDGAAAAVMNGHSLVVIGAPNAGPGGRGRVYVYRGLAEEPAFMIDADPSGAQLGGYFVSVVGDIDADGVPDVYASDFSDGGAFPGAGRIFVHSGADGSRLRVLSGTSQGEGFGIGPADAGDVDGDGHDDLVVGSWQYGSAAPSGGRATVHSGADGSVLRTITGQIPGETFGFDATGVGDVNGDGAIDYLLTSAWSSINGFQSGRMYIVSGAVPTGVPSGEEVIRAMHERYAESWYETLTFLQNTTNYDASGGVASVEKWYESIRLPGELRIDVAPVPDGRILLFRNDSLYTFQGGGAGPARSTVGPRAAADGVRHLSPTGGGDPREARGAGCGCGEVPRDDLAGTSRVGCGRGGGGYDHPPVLDRPGTAGLRERTEWHQRSAVQPIRADRRWLDRPRGRDLAEWRAIRVGGVHGDEGRNVIRGGCVRPGTPRSPRLDRGNSLNRNGPDGSPHIEAARQARSLC